MMPIREPEEFKAWEPETHYAKGAAVTARDGTGVFMNWNPAVLKSVSGISGRVEPLWPAWRPRSRETVRDGDICWLRVAD